MFIFFKKQLWYVLSHYSNMFWITNKWVLFEGSWKSLDNLIAPCNKQSTLLFEVRLTGT